MIEPVAHLIPDPLLRFPDLYRVPKPRIRLVPAPHVRPLSEDIVTLSRAARRIIDQERRLADMNLARDEMRGAS